MRFATRLRPASLLLAAALIPACAGRNAEPEIPPPPGPISVTVINTTGGPVTVGSTWDSSPAMSRHTVAANAETSYELPFDERQLRFEVEVAGATVRTNPLAPRPADRLRITVSPPARVVVDRLGDGGGRR